MTPYSFPSHVFELVASFAWNVFSPHPSPKFCKTFFKAFGEGFGDYSKCLLCDMGQDPFSEVPWFFIGMDMASIYLVLTKCQGFY